MSYHPSALIIAPCRGKDVAGFESEGEGLPSGSGECFHAKRLIIYAKAQ